MTQTIYILNGPNLDRLGKREPELYASESLADIQGWLERQCTGDELFFTQSSHEGELIEALFRAEDAGAQGVVFNPASYSHTSLALADALSALSLPVVEVHLTNIHGREEIRQRTLTGGRCRGVISGLGKFGYLAAIEFLRRAG